MCLHRKSERAVMRRVSVQESNKTFHELDQNGREECFSVIMIKPLFQQSSIIQPNDVSQC
jgi:hypothetical protein